MPLVGEPKIQKTLPHPSLAHTRPHVVKEQECRVEHCLSAMIVGLLSSMGVCTEIAMAELSSKRC